MYHGHMARLSPFAYPVVCLSPELRAEYLARFKAANIEVRPIIAGNITRQPFYMGSGLRSADMSGTDKISDCGFYFGIWPEMTDGDIDILKECLSYKGE
jgi:CDP-6-deoxy-D-xylo-4-hexulose-3-dehydrase